MRKKVSAKSAAAKKAASKKTNGKKFEFVPVDLLPIEGEDKGKEFFDVLGDLVGYTGDYALNKCRNMHSGWMLLPTVCQSNIPAEDSPPDYSFRVLDPEAAAILGLDNEEGPDSDDVPMSSPLEDGPPPTDSPYPSPSSQPLFNSQGTDEGLGSLPPSQGTNEDMPCTPDSLPGIISSSPDAGIEDPIDSGDNCMDVCESPQCENHEPIDGIENIPMDDVGIAPQPRRSMRQALRQCQIQDGVQQKATNEGNDTLSKDPPIKEIAVVKKEIQKKNTRLLPAKLKNKGESNVINSTPDWCARTFYPVSQLKSMKNALSLESPALMNNGALVKISKRVAEAVAHPKKKSSIVDEHSDSVDVVGLDDAVETAQDEPMTDFDDDLPPPISDDDIIIENNEGIYASRALSLPGMEAEMPLGAEGGDAIAGSSPSNEFLPNGEPEMPEDLNSTLAAAISEQYQMFREEVAKYVCTSDLIKRVQEWERTVKPFLGKVNKREVFDINEYGSRILNSFEESNRKQTKTFRDFCEGKEKWEIHRYFMALLPLVNVGNVSIETETRSDGDEDIDMTLLSRRMHHVELEQFGHNDGEHSD